MDLNHRPLGYEPNELPDCSTPQFDFSSTPPVRQTYSCLIQDEPEPAIGFSRKMSLKGKDGMLGIDHQHGRHRDHQPGADSGLPGRQRRGAVRRPAARGGVQLGREDPGTNRVCKLEQAREGAGATVPVADDGVKQGAGHALDCAPTAPENVLKVRKHLLDQQLLVPDGGSLRLARDYTFSSPSLAAGVMLGRSANGRIEWKDQHGRTLKGIQELSAD